MPYVVNENVHVPSLKAGLGEDYPYSMTSGAICELSDRNVRVNLPTGEISQIIPLSLVRKKLGLLIVEVGDFETVNI